ncbi:MAG: hypothetical protein C4530_09980 [Desulfobacteraceae bacterium]|nr:MAG: hypothetical protein C4530_09980 [Desulfobacteraceae bacterium]
MKTLGWGPIRHFKPDEFQDPDRMCATLVRQLDDMRERAGRQVRIHCSFELRDTDFSWHSYHRAVDCHIEGLHWFDQLLMACWFPFTGVGAYPWWNNPGLHLDSRPIQAAARWLSPAKGVYLPLNWASLAGYLKDPEAWKRT